MLFKTKILIVSGEASGDYYGACLMKKLRESRPNIEFVGMGGEFMRELSPSLSSYDHLSVTGITEVFKKAKTIFGKYKNIKNLILHGDIQLAILIDFPDFNFRLFRLLKKKNIPIIYYVSPQLWAWRKNRVKKIKKYVDKMLVIFPFEVDFYKKYGVHVHYVGHPLYKEASQIPLPIRTGSPVKIGIFPGSRSNEVKQLLPVLLKTVKKLASEGRFQFYLFKAPSLQDSLLKELCLSFPHIHVVEKKELSQLKDIDFALACSGTLTIELALLNIPMVVMYRFSSISYFISRLLVRGIKHFSMVNLILEEGYFPELLQGDVTPERLVFEISKFTHNTEKYKEALSKLKHFRQKLGSSDIAKPIDTIIVESIKDV